jgi:hypothetical protein
MESGPGRRRGERWEREEEEKKTIDFVTFSLELLFLVDFARVSLESGSTVFVPIRATDLKVNSSVTDLWLI